MIASKRAGLYERFLKWSRRDVDAYCSQLRSGFVVYIRGKRNGKHYNIKVDSGWYHDRIKEQRA